MPFNKSNQAMDCGDRTSLQLLQATGGNGKQSHLKLLLNYEDGLRDLGGTHIFLLNAALIQN